MSEWLSRASSGMDVEVEQSAVILSAFDLILSDMLISIFSWQNMIFFFWPFQKSSVYVEKMLSGKGKSAGGLTEVIHLRPD